MRADELMAELLGWSEEKIENTVDTCKAGDPGREVKKVAAWRICSSPTSPPTTSTTTT